MADAPHVRPLRAFARMIAAERGAAVPDPDPLDGGVEARLLLLLETPGPSIGRMAQRIGASARTPPATAAQPLLPRRSSPAITSSAARKGRPTASESPAG